MHAPELSASRIITNSIASNLKTGFNIAKRLGVTAKTVGTQGFKVANGKPVTAALVRESFEQLGATYIKLGQFIASSPSLFPRDYVEEFQLCLDQTSAMPFEYIHSVLKQELGDTLEKSFQSIDKEPLASASIAQVHVARLKSGEEVVIKVQKPNVGTIIHTDLSVVLATMKMAEFVMPKLKFASLSQVVDEIKKRMIEEADFTKEAENIADFQQFLSVSQNQQVVAPEVYPALSTKKVLTMQRFYGVPMTNPEQMKRFCDNPSDVLTTTLNTWFASVMMCPSFHADLHAGNLMLLEDGRIGFIDFGIVGKLNPTSWQASVTFMQALQVSDFNTMASSMVGMGMTDKVVNEALLAQDLKKMVDQVVGVEPEQLLDAQRLKNDADELNQLMLDIVQVGERHGIHFPRDFTLLIKQFLYFDRFMQIIAPDMDLFNDTNVHMLN